MTEGVGLTTKQIIYPPWEVRTGIGIDYVKVSAIQPSPGGNILNVEKTVMVRRPNSLERFFGVTFEQKIRRAIQKMRRHVDALNAELMGEHEEGLTVMVDRILAEDPPAPDDGAGRGWFQLYRQEDGQLYRRTLLGYRTEAQARDAAKAAWKDGYAVRIEQGRWRWHVWTSVPEA